VGPGKRLESRGEKEEGEDEFRPGMLRYTILNLVGERDKRLPELAKENSKVQRPRERDLTVAEENEIVMSGVISAQTRANKETLGRNRSADNVGRQAIGEPSRKHTHEGPLMQAEKRHEHYQQRTGVPGPVEVFGNHPRHGGVAGISSMAKEMSMLNPCQHPSPQQPQQANATSEARLPAAQSRSNSVSHGREAQQASTTQQHSSITAPVPPLLPQPKPQPRQPFNLPAPRQDSESHMQLLPPPRYQQHNLAPPALPTIARSNQLPSIGTVPREHSVLPVSPSTYLPSIQHQAQEITDQYHEEYFEPTPNRSDPNPFGNTGKLRSIMKPKH